MSKWGRRLLSVGSTLAMGCATGALVVGGCAGAPWPSNGKLPERVIDKLQDCGRMGPTPLQSTNYDLTFTVHVAEDETEARVDDVMLTSSTLHIDDVEACMREALYGMRTPLEALALRRRPLSPGPTPVPEARALLGQSEAILFLQVGAAIVVGFAVYNVIVHVVLDKPRPKRRPHPATSATEEPPPPTAAPVTSAAPTATPTPTATPMPTAITMPTATTSGDDDPCMPLLVECLENIWQPAWNRKNYGQKKDCNACYHDCKDHSKGKWPDKKCPRK